MQFRDGERESVETNVFIWECSETGSEMVMMRCISRVVSSEQFPGTDHTLVSESERHYNYGARAQFLIPLIHDFTESTTSWSTPMRTTRSCWSQPLWTLLLSMTTRSMWAQASPSRGWADLTRWAEWWRVIVLIDQCPGCCWPNHMNLFLSTSDYKSWISSEKYLLPAVIMVSLVLIFHQKSPRTWDPRRTNYD